MTDLCDDSDEKLPSQQQGIDLSREKVSVTRKKKACC
jgi:hypothetical protein